MPQTVSIESADLYLSQPSSQTRDEQRFVNITGILSPLFCSGLLLVLVSVCNAQAFTENFDDGDDDGWTLQEVNYARNRDVVAGVYQLTTDNPVLVGDLGHVISRFESKSPIGDGILRAKVTANTQGTSAGIALLTDSEPAEYYVFNGSSQGGGFNLWRSNGTAWLPNLLDSDFLGSPSGLPRFQAGEEWWLELGVVEGLVSVKAWPDGSSVPDQPQFTFLDSDPHPIAGFGVTGWISSGWNSVVHVDASFDDISFRPVPEPRAPAVWLTAICLLSLCRGR